MALPTNLTGSSTQGAPTSPPHSEMHNRTHALVNAIFNVKSPEYGALGDNATDDTAAIQAAYNAAGNGGIVFFPPGIYRYTGILNCNSDGVTLLGSNGSGDNLGTILRITHATNNGLVINGFRNKVKDIGFDSSVVRTGGYYIYFDTLGSNGGIEGVVMEDWWNGIGIIAEANVYVQRVTLSAPSTTTSGVGISVLAGDDHRLQNVSIYGNLSSEPSIGLNVKNCGNLYANNLSIIGCDQSLVMDPANGQGVFTAYFTNSFFDTSATRGLLINPTGTGSVARIRFMGCWFGGSVSDQGALLNNGGSGILSGVSFIDCHVVNNGNTGLQIEDATDIEVIGGIYAGNTNYGIIVASSVVDFRIKGALIGAGGGITGNTVYGILLNGSNDGFIIEGNDLRGNTSGAINPTSVVVDATKIIRNNLGYVTEAAGTGSIASGTTSAVITHGLSVTPTLKNLSITLGNLSTTDPGQIYVNTFTSTQFTVHCRTNPGASNLDFSWQALVI